MKKSFIYFATLLAVVTFLISSCEKKDAPSMSGVTIYGSVADQETLEPIAGALVEMEVYGGAVESVITGSDGTYECYIPIEDNPDNYYVVPEENVSYVTVIIVTASKYGYKETDANEQSFSVRKADLGRRIRVNFMLTSK